MRKLLLFILIINLFSCKEKEINVDLNNYINKAFKGDFDKTKNSIVLEFTKFTEQDNKLFAYGFTIHKEQKVGFKGEITTISDDDNLNYNFTFTEGKSTFGNGVFKGKIQLTRNKKELESILIDGLYFFNHNVSVPCNFKLQLTDKE